MIIEFGLSDTSSTCFPEDSTDALKNITVLDTCDLYSMGEDKTELINTYFEETCLGQSTCSFDLTRELFSDECLDILEERTDKNTGLNPQVYLQA